MFDFDPRDDDSRGERHGADQHRGGSGRTARDDRDDWSQPETRSRDRDDDTRELGRGPGGDSRGSDSDEHTRDRLDDARGPERDHDSRTLDPRDVFMRDLNLARG